MTHDRLFASSKLKHLFFDACKVGSGERVFAGIYGVVETIFQSRGLGSVVTPKLLTANAILAYVRAKKNSMNSNVETLYNLFENRVEAIGWALDHAGRGDIVVLCGKGHETDQEIGSEIYPLDEREVVAEYLAACR